MTLRAPRWGARAGLVLLAGFFAREALGGRTFFLRDLHLQWVGQVESFVRAVTSGAWPLWDPYVSFGQPMLANPNTQVLYPLTWLNLLMRPATYYTLYFSIHLVLAAFGAAALSRSWGASRAGGFVAGAGFMASGPFLSLGNLWNHLAGAAWMPWALLWADRALAGSRRAVAAWAVATAAPILAGSPDMALLGLVPVAAVAVTRLDWRRPLAAANRSAALASAAALVLGAGLAAAQILPSLELALRSTRSVMSPEWQAYWSVHPAALVQALLPLAWHALPWSAGAREVLFQSREPYLLSLYMGLPLLALAGLGLVPGGVRYRAALAWSAVACVLLAAGQHTPVFSVATAALPPLRALRFPAKALVPAALCLCVLAGFGYDRWRARAPGRGLVFASGAAAALAALLLLACARWPQAVAASVLSPGASPDALAPARSAALRLATLSVAVVLLAWVSRRGAAASRIGAAAASALAILDLAALHAGLNPTAPADLFRWRPDPLQAIDQADGRRLFVYDYHVQPGLSRRHLGRDEPYPVRAGPSAETWHGALAMRAYPVPPVAAGYGLFDSFGRDLLGIQPRHLARLNAAFFANEGTAAFRRLLAVGAVKDVLALHDPGVAGLDPVQRWRGPFLEDVRLLRFADALPRAFVVGEGRIGDIDTLLDPAFDPSRSAVVSDVPAAPASGPAGGRARILELRADSVRLEVTAEGPALMVLVDTWDPGWRVRLDGAPVPLLRANVAFRGVAVPAGTHRVEMVYRPRWLGVGIGLSILAALAAVACLTSRPVAARGADGPG